MPVDAGTLGPAVLLPLKANQACSRLFKPNQGTNALTSGFEPRSSKGRLIGCEH
jgi:hypothetical protein